MLKLPFLLAPVASQLLQVIFRNNLSLAIFIDQIQLMFIWLDTRTYVVTLSHFMT